MITVQEANQAAIEHQLSRTAEQKQSRSEPISGEPRRHEDLDPPPGYTKSGISQDRHDDNIHKADVLNDALCFFASISESLAAVACMADKISSGLSLVPYPSDSMQGVRHFLLKCHSLPSLPGCVVEILEYFNFKEVLEDHSWHLHSHQFIMKRAQQRLNSPSFNLMSWLFQHEFGLLRKIQGYLFESESPNMNKTVQCVYKELSKQLDCAYNGFKIEWAAISAVNTHHDSSTIKDKGHFLNEFQSRMLNDEILTRPMLPQSVSTSQSV